MFKLTVNSGATIRICDNQIFISQNHLAFEFSLDDAVIQKCDDFYALTNDDGKIGVQLNNIEAFVLHENHGVKFGAEELNQ